MKKAKAEWPIRYFPTLTPGKGPQNGNLKAPGGVRPDRAYQKNSDHLPERFGEQVSSVALIIFRPSSDSAQVLEILLQLVSFNEEEVKGLKKSLAKGMKKKGLLSRLF